MNGWSKEDLEEECGDEIIDQLAFLSGCYRHKLSNSDPSGWIISDEDLRKFAEYIVRECINIACEYDKPKLSGPGLAIACNIESHFDIYIEEDGRFVK